MMSFFIKWQALKHLNNYLTQIWEFRQTKLQESGNKAIRVHRQLFSCDEDVFTKFALLST